MGRINLAHPTLTEHLDYPVMSERLSRQSVCGFFGNGGGDHLRRGRLQTLGPIVCSDHGLDLPPQFVIRSALCTKERRALGTIHFESCVENVLDFFRAFRWI